MHLARQAFQPLFVIGAVIDAWRAMQPPVFEPRPSPWSRVGADARRIHRSLRNAIVHQQGLGVRPGFVSGFKHHIPCKTPPETDEKSLGNRLDKFQRRRQLHQQAAQAIAQPGTLQHKLLERLATVLQTLHVCDLLGHLDAEAKAGRHAGAPALVGLDAMRAIKRAVDLNAVQSRRITLQVGARSRKGRRIFPAQAPTGAPCEN
ncbi:hypothetical protein D3C81_1608950 [compost metagenome]